MRTTRLGRRVHGRPALVAKARLGVALAVTCFLMVGCSDSGTSATRTPHHPGSSPRVGGPIKAKENSSNGPFASGPAATPARHTGPQGSFGQFVTDCALSHSAAEDPIVYPDGMDMNDGTNHTAGTDQGQVQGQGHGAHGAHGATGHGTGGSHLHNFFGNTTTGSSSTLDSLLAGNTTCQKKLDKAAYWAPALYDHGKVVQPTKSTAYYRVAPKVDPASVEAFPPGLKVIAGDSSATEPQSPDLVGWSCGTSTIHFQTPPDCPVSAPLRSVITFPDCWDGVNTDSADHRSHMTNSTDGLCPKSHPVHVPQLTFSITYPVFGSGHTLALASGPVESLHSDFINSWHQESLEEEIGNCIRRNITCGVSSNRGEEFLFEGY